MLDIFLKVAHEHEAKQAHSLELAKALSHLPEEELKELARTGEIKLASAENWSAQFVGTELYTKAIELEADACLLATSERTKEASAEVRVKQRLLEMKKAASVTKEAISAEKVQGLLNKAPRARREKFIRALDKIDYRSNESTTMSRAKDWRSRQRKKFQDQAVLTRTSRDKVVDALSDFGVGAAAVPLRAAIEGAGAVKGRATYMGSTAARVGGATAIAASAHAIGKRKGKKEHAEGHEKQAAGTQQIAAVKPPMPVQQMAARPASAAMGHGLAQTQPMPQAAPMPTTVSRGKPVQEMRAQTPSGREWGQPKPGSGIKPMGSAPLPPPLESKPFPKDPAAYAPSMTHERDHTKPLTFGPERGSGMEHQEMGSRQRVAAFKKSAMDAGLMAGLKTTAGSGPKMALKKGGNQFSARGFNAEAQALTPKKPVYEAVADPFGHAKAASVQWADEAGRIFARNDMAKLADATTLLKALKPHAGAIIGGGLGALHGLAKKDGGVGDALMEGTAGAAVGSGAQRLAKHPEVAGLVDKAKTYLAKGKPGEQLSLDKIGAAMRASRMQKEAMGAFLAAGAKAIPGLLGAAKSALPAVTGAAKSALPAAAKALPAAAKAVPAVAEAAAPAAKAGGGLVSQGMDWLKNNKLKAGISTVQGVQAVKASRDSGEGLGSSLMSGLASAAPTALA